ncbi:hypothetical protein MLD63_02695 (plasmid) [Paracoccus sp. TK19116]|uniref:DUF3072 domain-containing protein n=1 Tax=Paracoccus albicereus TaxID=2922394 RepID=A0ABT1MR13_9RHOB|nr:hypothetical protein [Paracoccus albicereus]MCQ0969346.1 hypothetical protein [Paracoccus albicereus]
MELKDKPARASWDTLEQVFPAEGPPMSPYLHYFLERSGRDSETPGDTPPPDSQTEEALRDMIEGSFGQ